MTTSRKQQGAKVVELRPKENEKKSEKKWGRKVLSLGFSMVPSLIFRAQKRLGLSPTQLAVLLQLADYWWEKERRPFPSKQTLADRLGLSARQVQRHIADLEMAGLLKRIPRRASHRGKLTNEYDLSGLVEKLKKLAPEFKKVEEETKNLRRQVKRRGGLKRRRTK